MHYYIDGYNLLFYLAKDTSSLENQKNNIISILNEAFKISNVSVTIVFDGKDFIDTNYSYYDSLKIVYTEKGLSADDYILEQLEAKSPKTQITVVTSDKSLALLCKDKKAHTKSLKSFIQWVIKQERKSHLSQDEKKYIDTEANIKRLQEIFEKRLNS